MDPKKHHTAHEQWLLKISEHLNYVTCQLDQKIALVVVWGVRYQRGLLLKDLNEA